MLSTFPSVPFVVHRGQAGGRGLSPRLWDRVKGQALSPDGNSNAFFCGDDFLNFSGFSPAISGTTALPSTTVPAPSGYGVYVDTTTSACSIAPIATESGGVVQLTVGATDNHEAWLTSGGNTGVLGAISDTAGSDKLTIFEARLKTSSIADNVAAFFVGLGEEGLAAANTKADDTGVLASKDLIGFDVVQADGDAINFVYRKAGAALQTKIAGVQVPVADTYYKLGFVYDPAAPASKRIKVFVDNVEQSTYVTADDIAASTFPDGEELAFLAGLKTGAATSFNLKLDWWAYYQEG